LIRVAALTAGRFVPSTRFRVRQYIEPLRRLGIHVRERRALVEKYSIAPFPAARQVWRAARVLSRIPLLLPAWGSDVVWLEREMIAGRYTLERFLPRRTVVDVDDAIWLIGQPGHAERIVRRCRGVIAGNRFIAEHYRGLAERVWLVPTSVDTDSWRPEPRPERGDWIVGWIGSWDNLGYLKWIEEPLAEFLALHADARLLVVCDSEPVFERLPRRSWFFERWSEAGERESVRKMNVGLMPLPDIDWAQGKCGAKMLQYMALGIPALVSPVGSGAEILAEGEVGLPARNPGEWFAGLERLYADRPLAARCGQTARAVTERAYSLRTNAPRLAQIFQEVAGL
jgi:glycosyltransferase involved in cell wall biosynthesis